MNTKIQELKAEVALRIDQIKEQQNNFYILLAAFDRFPQLEDFSHFMSLPYSGETIDFDFPSHETTIEIIKALGGKWTKALNGTDKIDYTASIDGVKFRIYAGSPPPSCQIIEEVVVVPSHYTPETTKTIRRLQCVPEISGPVSE